jgi:hypothetical protein
MANDTVEAQATAATTDASVLSAIACLPILIARKEIVEVLNDSEPKMHGFV